MVEELDEGLVGGRREVGVEEPRWSRSGEELVEEGQGWGVGGPLVLTHSRDDPSRLPSL